MGALNQLCLLLWKNWILKKRHWISTIFQVLVPVVLFVMLMWVRSLVTPPTYIKTPTYGTPFDPLDYKYNLAPNSRYSVNGINISYCPDNWWTSEVVGHMKQILAINVTFQGYRNEAEMIMNMRGKSRKAIIFTTDLSDSQKNTAPAKIKYTIRFPTESRDNWKTDMDYESLLLAGPRRENSPNYIDTGFAALQHAAAVAIINTRKLNKNVTELSFNLEKFPYPPFTEDFFAVALQKFLPSIITFCFLYNAINLIRALVMEKEQKLKESMKIMGLRGWMHWTSWFITTFLTLLISIVIIGIIIKINTGKNGIGSVITQGDATVIVAFLILYACALIMFCFAISVLFSKANLAAGISVFLWFITFIPYNFVEANYSSTSTLLKLITCLLPNSAAALGTQIIGFYEIMGVGASWETLDMTPPVSANKFSLLHIFLVLIVDCVLYGLFTWYINAVFPGEFGVPEPWYFFLTKVYWCGTSSKKTKLIGVINNNILSTYFEAEPRNLNAGIEINGLTKIFGPSTAVDELNLKMFKGQITALLGHNGAGKTTTISMLTGMFPPSYGTAYVNGYDIVTNSSQARESLGICPQHDVLWPDLTVQEHLYFYCKLKDYPDSLIQSEISRILECTGMTAKKDAMSSTLSGGMKRRLSVGIALAGESNVVILDEPTSGMDPSARREIWDLLQTEKKNRTILLTTHFMEEADYLGDRIAIMAKGQLKCSGSSIFLKQKYGDGYHLTIIKQPQCHVTYLDQLIKSYIPTATIENNVAAELSYVLPHNQRHMFEGLFNELEERKENLNINGYGASITTMEEVFLKVGEEADGNIKDFLHKNHDDLDNDRQLAVNGNNITPVRDSFMDDLSCMLNVGPKLFLQQFAAMFVKKLLHIKRSYIFTLVQIFVPLGIVALFVWLIKSTDTDGNEFKKKIFNFNNFRPGQMPYTYDRETTEVNMIVNSFKSQFQDGINEVYKIDDVYGGNISSYILAQPLEKVTVHMMTALQIKSGKPNPHVKVFYNNEPLHTVGGAISSLDTLLLQYCTNIDSIFEVTNHPFSISDSELYHIKKQPVEPFPIVLSLLFTIPVLVASFILFLIREQTSKSKQQQMVSGVRLPIFWITHFICDFLVYLMPVTLIIILFAISGIEILEATKILVGFMVIFALFAWNAFPQTYLLSMYFGTPSGGFVKLFVLYFITGLGCMIAIAILSIKDLGTQKLASVLEYVFVISPSYVLSWSAMNMMTNYKNNEICKTFNISECSRYINFICCPENCGQSYCPYYTENLFAFKDPGIGKFICSMLISGTIYWILITCVELKIFQKLLGRMRKPGSFSLHNQSSEDDDVRAERTRVNQISNSARMNLDIGVLLKDLRKFYGKFEAVKGLSLAIQPGECFGLLGINGAGKTTTFKMLTGDEKISAGEAFIEGYNVSSQLDEVRKRVGYCPQFDALLDMMTGTETITMFCRLRGMPEHRIPTIIEKLAKKLLFSEHLNKLVKGYSGGTKRKLSTAIALIGGPSILFLDEPTTGMDAVARRLLWDTISKVRESGRTIVLTSHSMEECEVLCTRLAIMVGGCFACLGSSQQLKNKYGDGYTLVVKIKRVSDADVYVQDQNISAVKYFIQNQFPGSILKEDHQDLLQYQLPRTAVKWGTIFGLMERATQELKIEDYSVSQTTLEQVFINFANKKPVFYAAAEMA